MAVIDVQPVPCIPVRGPRGYGAAKQALGRKRVALADADGTWLAVAVVPGGMQDRDCLGALTGGKQAWPSLREAVLDGASAAERCREWPNLHGMRHRVVGRDPGQKGFVVLERSPPAACDRLLRGRIAEGDGGRARLRLAGALGRAAA